MSQHAGEDHPQHNVSDVNYEVVDRDKRLMPPVGTYVPWTWPDDVRAIKP